MGFDFRPQAAKHAADRADRGVSEAHEAHERTLRSTGDVDDAEFWLAIVFKGDADMAEFTEIADLGDLRSISGEQFRQKTKKFTPERRLKSFPKRYAERRTRGNVDWMAGIPANNRESAELTLISCLTAMLGADLEPMPCLYVYFRDRADKTAFIDEMGIARHGNKYVDGSSWLLDIRERMAG